METTRIVPIIIILVISVIALSGIVIRIQEYTLEKKGILPPRNSTTLDDIRRLRDSGMETWAIRRFRQMPANKKKYTLLGAKDEVKNL